MASLITMTDNGIRAVVQMEEGTFAYETLFRCLTQGKRQLLCLFPSRGSQQNFLHACGKVGFSLNKTDGRASYGDMKIRTEVILPYDNGYREYSLMGLSYDALLITDVQLSASLHCHLINRLEVCV